MSISMLIKWALLERQQFLELHFRVTKCCIVTSFESDCVGHSCRHEVKLRAHCAILEMSVNIVGPFFGIVSLIIKTGRGCCDTWSMYGLPVQPKTPVTASLLSPKPERQRSVNDFCSCILDNHTAVRCHSAIIEVLAALKSNNAIDNIAMTFCNCTSTECQCFQVLRYGWCRPNATMSTENGSIGRRCEQKCNGWSFYYLLKMSVNEASTILGVVSCIVWGQWNGINQQTTNRLELWAMKLVTISCPPPTIERPQSVNTFCRGPVS